MSNCAVADFVPNDWPVAFMFGTGRTKPIRNAWMERQIQARGPFQYAQLPRHGTLRIRISPAFQQREAQYRGLPTCLVLKFWAVRLEGILNQVEQTQILNTFNAILGLDVRAYQSDMEQVRHPENSATLTHHFGRWYRQGNPPALSRDARQPDIALPQRLERQIAILHFCACISQICWNNIRPRLRTLDKHVFHRMAAAASVANDMLDDTRSLPAALQAVSGTSSHPPQFGGLGTMVAVTKGQAENAHIDIDDGDYSIVIPTAPGGWGDEWLPDNQLWGQILLPQLGQRMPLRAGQVLIFRANCLLHLATPLPPAN